MLRLYKKEDGVLLYAECWVNNKRATLHTGTVGQNGQSKESYCFNETSYIKKFRNNYEAQGYAQWPEQLWHWVVLQWPMQAFEPSRNDFETKDQATALLNELLGWQGLGYVDGFDMGRTLKSPTVFVLNVFCVVVDSDIAIQSILNELPEQMDCSKLKIANRAPNEGLYQLKYSADPEDNVFLI